MKEQVAGRTGASWEDRLQEQKAKKVQAMKMIEKEPINSQVLGLADDIRVEWASFSMNLSTG